MKVQKLQIDLFNLIGGSWPPAPREPERTDYGSVPRNYKPTMQRSSQNERIKSANLLAHIAPERRRVKNISNNQTPPVTEEIRPKMVQDTKKIETGILVG